MDAHRPDTSLLRRTIDAVEGKVARMEPSIAALVPEPDRFERLRREARALVGRHPAADSRPPLFGLLLGVKDIFHVTGLPTHAGSRLPAAALAGAEAESVSRLVRAGALVLGKTVTTEFAHFAPGPTRNPCDPAHTPGGSSSGSAAAVAAGYCEAALGTQTIGSILRPASFCGVVGMKPTRGRVTMAGVIPLSPSLDQAGCLAIDVRTAARVARVLFDHWRAAPNGTHKPILGIPEGLYLERAAAGTVAWFRRVCDRLAGAGYELRRLRVMDDFAAIVERQHAIVAAEAARVHAAWFSEYASLYGPVTADLIRRGQSIPPEQLDAALAAREAFRDGMCRLMEGAGIDAWICPAATGPAPRGLESTGDPVMNLPWTQAGLPAIAVPAGHIGALPMGLQIVGRWNEDEALLRYAEAVEAVTTAGP